LFIFFVSFGLPLFAGADEIGLEYGNKLEFTFAEELTPNERDTLERFNKNPAWSPDGNWIAFTDGDGQSIRMVPAEGGIAVTVYKINDETGTKAFIREICFTPDSQKIVFVVVVVDPELGGITLQHDDGSVSYEKSIPNIHSINIYSGEYRILKQGGFDPSWSRDGRYMAYVEFDERTWAGDITIQHNGAPAIYDTITGETRYPADYIMTDISFLNGDYQLNTCRYPRISPDKKTVYLSLTVSESHQIARIPFEGGTPEILTTFTHEGTRCDNIDISPDCSWVCFDTSNQIVLYNIEAGALFDFFTGREYEENTAENPAPSSRALYHVSWAPNGEEICYTMSEYDPEPVYENIYITSFNPGRYSLNGTTVDSRAPAVFSTVGNYPNPFNASTAITFILPKSEQVIVDVYNVAGQKMATLTEGFMTAGTHAVSWDASGFSTGIYFAKVRAGISVEILKLALIK